MKHHSELINYLIKLRDLKSYLEIGTFNRSHNFEKISCENKVCVDPDPSARADYPITSDDFFSHFSEFGHMNASSHKFITRFDLIFIDGLHHNYQVRKDFNNALAHLSPRGFIVMHDCNPPTEITTCIPRGKQREWCGDTYKFAARLGEYDGIDFVTFDFDYGCAVVWKNWAMRGRYIGEMNWKIFTHNREELLRLYPISDIDNLIKATVNYEQFT